MEFAQKIDAAQAENVWQDDLRDVMTRLRMTKFNVSLGMAGAPSAFTGLLYGVNHGGKIALLGIPPSQTAIDWTQLNYKSL